VKADALSDKEMSQREEPRPVGDIEEFVLAVLRPAQDGQASISELLSAYQQWCERNQLEAIEERQFVDRFRRLAKAVQLPQSGGQFSGIGLARGAC
jgi:hypothetical protein